jgi:hypothetical protein
MVLSFGARQAGCPLPGGMVRESSQSGTGGLAYISIKVELDEGWGVLETRDQILVTEGDVNQVEDKLLEETFRSGQQGSDMGSVHASS